MNEPEELKLAVFGMHDDLEDDVRSLIENKIVRIKYVKSKSAKDVPQGVVDWADAVCIATRIGDLNLLIKDHRHGKKP